jgi:hypothetical protein
MSTSSPPRFKRPPFYACYLLRSISRKNTTYIGSTPHPPRVLPLIADTNHSDNVNIMVCSRTAGHTKQDDRVPGRYQPDNTMLTVDGLTRPWFSLQDSSTSIRMGMAKSSLVPSGTTCHQITPPKEIRGKKSICKAQTITDSTSGNITRDAWIRRMAKMAGKSIDFR